MKDAQYWIKKLGLQKHPESGYYKETYRSNEFINADHLPSRYEGNRNYSTAIYFLLALEEFSPFHRLKSDEIFHFYEGCCLNVHIINSQGHYSLVKLGRNWDNNENFQIVMKAGDWFASIPSNPKLYSLIGCTVAPGFDFKDFELGKREELIKFYPQHSSVIETLTRV